MTSVATSITSEIVVLDTCASVTPPRIIEYDDIALNETVLSKGSQWISFYADCGDNYRTAFEIRISSHGYHFWSDTFYIDVISSIDELNASIVKEFNLEQNFPNPFNPKTIINYELPITNYVELSIFNLVGQKVATLVSQRQKAGTHQVEWDATGFASGVYYYQLVAGDYWELKKMILLR